MGQIDQFFHAPLENGLNGFHRFTSKDEAKFQQKEFWLKEDDGVVTDEVTKVFPHLISLVEQGDEEVTIPLFLEAGI